MHNENVVKDMNILDCRERGSHTQGVNPEQESSPMERAKVKQLSGRIRH